MNQWEPPNAVLPTVEAGIDIHHVEMEMIGPARRIRRLERRRRQRSQTHHDTVHFIASLERGLYGEVVSDSVRDHVEECLYDPHLMWSD